MIQIEYNNLMPSQLRNKVFFAVGLLAILVFSVVINPDQNDFLPCFFKEITGYSCPVCGLSHSFYAVSHFHVKEAFRFHFMGPVLYGMFLFLFVKFSIEAATKKNIRFGIHPLVGRIFLIMFFWSWLIYWVMRFLSEL